MNAAVEVAHLTKTFASRRAGHNGRRALDGVSLEVRPGEMVALIGASGSGKSTLLRHIAGLVAGDASSGAIRVFGAGVQTNGRVAADIRAVRRQIGFVFQQFNLVGRLSVITNVMAGALGRVPRWRGLLHAFTEAERRQALAAMARVGIAELAFQRASTLSGGQQQRAAIARTLMQEARVILADEPIASLDPESARRTMQTLAQINREDGTTVLVSLHQVGFALRYCQRVVALKDGRVAYDGPAAALDGERLAAIYGTDSDIDFSEIEPTTATAARPRAGAGIPVAVPA